MSVLTCEFFSQPMNFHVCQSKWHGFWPQEEFSCIPSYCQYAPWKQTLPGTRLSSPRQRTSRCLECLNKTGTNETSSFRGISRTQTLGISLYCAGDHPDGSLLYRLKDCLSSFFFSFPPSFSLLALGLKHFEGTEYPKPLISKYLLPTKTAHQLTVRIKNLNMNRAPDNIIRVSDADCGSVLLRLVCSEDLSVYVLPLS